MSKYDGVAYTRKLRDDPVFFLQNLWSELGKDRVHPLGDLDIEAWLWAVGHGSNVPMKRGVLQWRGAGKTTMLSVPLSCYRLLRDPNRKILFVSKSGGSAASMLEMNRDWIGKVWFLQHLRPHGEMKDSATAFNVVGHDGDKQPSVKSLGIDGQLEGNRAHSILPDDIETKGNTQTHEARERLHHFTSEFSNIIYTEIVGEQPQIDPLEIVEFGTIKCDDTLYVKQEKQGYRFRTYPMAYPEPGRRTLGLSPLMAERLASGRVRPGQVSFAHRVPQSAVAEKESVGRLEFEREFMLYIDVGTAHTYPLRLADLIVYDCDHRSAPLDVTYGKLRGGDSTRLPIPSLGFGEDGFYAPMYVDASVVQPYHIKAMVIDPSAGGRDKLGFAAGGSMGSQLYIFEVGGLEGGASTENRMAILRKCIEYDIRQLVVEANGGGQFLADLFTSDIAALARTAPLTRSRDGKGTDSWHCAVETLWSSGQKETRIITTCDPLFTAHRVCIHPRVAQNQEWQRQTTRLTFERNCLGQDDEIDAFANLLKVLAGNLTTNQSIHAAQVRQQIEEDEAELNSDTPPRPANWITYRNR
jgi:hypothetical protein